MIVITKMQARILEHLEKYKFLTSSQLVLLNTGHITRVREAARKLAGHPSFKKPLTGVVRFPVSARFGRLENVFYLTPQGAEVLADMQGLEPSEIDFPKAVTVFHHDYHHRKYCIDFQIRLNQAIEEKYSGKLELALFDRYFDKTGANRTKKRAGRLRARTRGDFDTKHYIIPDANFILQKPDNHQVKALFCLEMTNGKDTKRVLKQIEKHKQAMQQGILAQKYHLKTNHKTLFIFSEKSLMKSVWNRFFEVDEIENFQHLFYFSYIEHTANDVLGCWKKAGESSKQYFNFINGKESEF